MTGISSKDIRDIYILRSMLEGLCARWATEHITEEQLDELEEVILLSEFHMKKVSGNNADQVTDLDGKFHKILYEASDSRILSHVLMDFHKYVQQARRNSVVSEERARSRSESTSRSFVRFETTMQIWQSSLQTNTSCM